MPADFPGAVIFDLDGTLMDTAPDLARVLNEVLAHEGLRTVSLAEARPLIGGGARLLLERAFAAVGRTMTEDVFQRLLEHFLALYTKEPARTSAPFPGAVALLQTLHQRGVKIGLCSNKPHDLSVKLLDHFELTPLFSGIIGGGVAGAKPSAEPLHHVLAQMEARPAESVMVGDTLIDLEAARAAEMGGVIGVKFGYSVQPVEEFQWDALIDHFAEFESALASLTKAGQNRE